MIEHDMKAKDLVDILAIGESSFNNDRFNFIDGLQAATACFEYENFLSEYCQYIY
jgi:hypothetical protein